MTLKKKKKAIPRFKAHKMPMLTCISIDIQNIQSTIVGVVVGVDCSASVPSTCGDDFLCLVFTHLTPALSLTLSPVPNLTPKMQAVYLRSAEAIPLRSTTRCFIPKRDLFSKINGERKGLPK